MAVIIVNDVTDAQDVADLIAFLADALATGQSETLLAQDVVTLTRGSVPTPAELAQMVRLDEDDVCTNPQHRPGCSCVGDAANTDPRQTVFANAPRVDGPIHYAPCSHRGLHRALTDCWMCWCDVDRGVMQAEDALLAQVG